MVKPDLIKRELVLFETLVVWESFKKYFRIPLRNWLKVLAEGRFLVARSKARRFVAGFTPLQVLIVRPKPRRFVTGFSLVELMVVIVIIGILATLILPQYKKAVERSRQAEAYTNLGVIRNSQVRYYAEYADYAYDANWAALDVPQPDTYFFSYSLPASSSWTATCVARATRQAKQNPGYGSYIVDISANGTVTKTKDGSYSTPP